LLAAHAYERSERAGAEKKTSRELERAHRPHSGVVVVVGGGGGGTTEESPREKELSFHQKRERASS
jgi:hypothetical protein